MLLLKWFTWALAFLALPKIIPGIEVAGFGTALFLALMWGLVNITLKPLLLLLTLPVNVLTLGLFTFVVNAALLALLGNVFEGFETTGFLQAFLGALFLSLVSVALQVTLGRREKSRSCLPPAA